MGDQQILVIMVSAEMKDDLIDTLAGIEGITGFNMITMAGYSKEHSHYDLREQVVGYRQLFKFEVMHEHSGQVELITALRSVDGAANIRYWIAPILEHGHL